MAWSTGGSASLSACGLFAACFGFGLFAGFCFAALCFEFFAFGIVAAGVAARRDNGALFGGGKCENFIVFQDVADDGRRGCFAGHG